MLIWLDWNIYWKLLLLIVSHVYEIFEFSSELVSFNDCCDKIKGFHGTPFSWNSTVVVHNPLETRYTSNQIDSFSLITKA